MADASLDKSAENVKMKAEDDGKSSYDQVIDELAELLRERKDSKALSFWDKLESRVSPSDELETPKGEQTNKDSGDGLGSILNNFAYNLHEKGIGQDYFWELNYQDIIR